MVFSAIVLALAPAKGLAAQQLTANQVYRANAPSVVQVEVVGTDGRRAQGTGFFIGRGIVATNHHIVRNFARGRIVFGANRRQIAIRRVLASQPNGDLALISVPGTNIRPVGRAAAARVRPGDRVYVIGNPAGLQNTLTPGMVSGLRLISGKKTLQISMPATQGSSGSPVLNDRGELVGVIRSVARKGTQLVFATPVAQLEVLRTESSSYRNDRTTARAPVATRAPATRTATQARKPFQRRKGSPIRIGVPQRQSAEATAHVLKAILDRISPYRVELRRGSDEEIFAGMASRNGQFDIHPEVRMPNMGILWERFVDRENSVKTNASGFTGFSGLCVPGYVQDRYGIKRIEDLDDPKIARLFAPAAGGRARMWIGAPRWKQTAVWKLKARYYRFASRFDLYASREDEFLKELERNLAEKIPVLFACYAPHWLVAKHDVVALAEPEYSPECFDTLFPVMSLARERSGDMDCTSPAPKMYIAYSRRLDKKAAKLAHFLSDFHLNHRIVSEWSVMLQDPTQPPSAIARKWAAPFTIDELQKF